MLRSILIASLSILITAAAFAQQKPDDPAYEQRKKIFLEKLDQLPSPQVYHPISGGFWDVKAYTPDGLVLIQSDEEYFLWSFPEGKVLSAYVFAHTSKRTGLPAVTGILEADIYGGAYLDPSGTLVGFNQKTGEDYFMTIYHGSQQKLKLKDKHIVSLFDGKALVKKKTKKTAYYEHSGLEVINIETGQTLYKFKESFPQPIVDIQHDLNKVFFLHRMKDVPSITVFDAAKPESLVTKPETEALAVGYIDIFSSKKDNDMFRTFRSTNESEPLPGYEYAGQYSRITTQGKYLIIGEHFKGVRIYDIEKGKYLNENYWQTEYHGSSFVNEKFVYFPKLNKLLVHSSFSTTPYGNEKGRLASAYMIDMATGDLTPYIMHQERTPVKTNNNTTTTDPSKDLKEFFVNFTPLALPYTLDYNTAQGRDISGLAFVKKKYYIDGYAKTAHAMGELAKCGDTRVYLLMLRNKTGSSDNSNFAVASYDNSGELKYKIIAQTQVVNGSPTQKADFTISKSGSTITINVSTTHAGGNVTKETFTVNTSSCSF
jgi:hypothetical protein